MTKYQAYVMLFRRCERDQPVQIYHLQNHLHMPNNKLCYRTFCCIFSISKRTVSLAWVGLKIAWFIGFVVSWCLLVVSWLLVLYGISAVLKIRFFMMRSKSPPATAVESTRGSPRANTAATAVSPRATRSDRPTPASSSGMTSSTTTSVRNAVGIPATSGTSGDKRSAIATKVQFNSVRQEVCSNSTAGPLTGKTIPKSCTTKHGSSNVPELLLSSASSSLPVVSTDTKFAATSSSTSTVALKGHSSSRHVASPTNSDVTSSVNRVQNDITNSASNDVAFVPTTKPPVPAPRQHISNYKPANVHISTDVRSSHQFVTGESKPVNSTAEDAHIADRNVQRITGAVKPTHTMPSLDTAFQRADSSSHHTSGTSLIAVCSQHITMNTSTAQNTSVKPDIVRSAAAAIHSETMKSCATVDSFAWNDGSVSASSSSLSSPLSRSHSISYTSSDCDTASTDNAPTYTINTNTTRTHEHSQFPLSYEYEFRLVCGMCFKPKTEQMLPKTAHRCRQDILAVAKIGTSQWRWIRQRKTFVKFIGDYKMCIKHQYGVPNSCFSGCTYAHCDAERRLWNLEKTSTFTIAEFISAHQTSAPICSVQTLLDEHPGNFLLTCKFCFEKSNVLTTTHSDTCSRCKHSLTDILVHKNINNQLVTIGQRHFTHSTAFYALCNFLQFCRSRESCVNAHSLVERDVWYLQRDYDYTWLQIVDEARRASTASCSSTACPYEVTEACSQCLNNNTVSQKQIGEHCCRHKHSWTNNVAYIRMPEAIRLRALPAQCRLTVCRSIQRAATCRHYPRCWFAHSEEELQVWRWMAEHRGKTFLNSNTKRHYFRVSKQVLEVSLVSCHTGAEPSTPLVDSLVPDTRALPRPVATEDSPVDW